MADADAFAAGQREMDIRSSGLVHSAETDILRLQQILREGYASGFTIFKELLQNAEDAGARRMVVAGHTGFDGAVNPLLRTPGLIVANDGPVLALHMDAITRASGGSKANERSAVGRFGLGQKSVYHLCDAFIALGRVEDREGQPQMLIMNPWEQVAEADAARGDWPKLATAEGQMLLDMANTLGMKQGMALFLPLRTAKLRPGTALCLSDRDWQPDDAIADILDGEELAATLCCLRNLETVDIIPIAGGGRRISMRSGARRLSGPGAESGTSLIGGEVDGAGFGLTFSGRQQWKVEGQAAQLLEEDGWDKVFDIHGKLIPPKANPHGAVILCRSAAREGAARLRLRNAVYLPLGEPVFNKPLERGADNIDLLVHGYFFVPSDRRKLRDDDHIETRWNRALRREAALPLLLDALAEALPGLPDEAERHALIRALSCTPWWNEHRAEACQDRALARCWPGDDGRESWRVCPGASVRLLMRGEATSLRRLKDAFPGLEGWCGENKAILAFGTVLADCDPRWPDAQLAELVRLAGPAAFQKGHVAETLAAVLDAAGPGNATRAALAETCRGAIAMVEQRFASAEKLNPLVRHLPENRVVALPPSVENREIICALAATGESVPVQAAWTERGGEIRKLGIDETINLLAAVEPFLSARGSAAQEASALVSHLLRNGPSLDVLAANVRRSHRSNGRGAESTRPGRYYLADECVCWPCRSRRRRRGGAAALSRCVRSQPGCLAQRRSFSSRQSACTQRNWRIHASRSSRPECRRDRSFRAAQPRLCRSPGKERGAAGATWHCSCAGEV